VALKKALQNATSSASPAIINSSNVFIQRLCPPAQADTEVALMVLDSLRSDGDAVLVFSTHRLNSSIDIMVNGTQASSVDDVNNMPVNNV
jgi:hypothetical protein